MYTGKLPKGPATHAAMHKVQDGEKPTSISPVGTAPRCAPFTRLASDK